MFKFKNMKKSFVALVLTFVMIFGAVCPAGAASADGANAIPIFAKTFDKVFDVIADGVINFVVKALLSADPLGLIAKSNRFPTTDEYLAEEHEYFYEGSDGEQSGAGWKLGYASTTVIPEKWRRNADGKEDPNGMCLNKTYYFGGYFGSKVNNIYDDERVNLVVLSAGADANANGIEDIIILASIDNIGVANGNVRDIRKAVSDALVAKGLAADDIVAFEFNSTHAHTTVEALGMSLGKVFTTAMKNHFLFTKERSIEDDLYDTILANTAAAAVEAYDNLEPGTLSYFETENVNDYMKANAYNRGADGSVGEIIRDKLEYGADCRQYFSCWYFEGESGEKTVLSNIGLHPTFAGRSSDRVCADVPHYIWKVMADEGYNYVFIQGSQAAIGLSGYYTEAGYNYAQANKLSYEEWVNRYGEKYASKRYNGNKDEDGENEYFDIRATGYSLAHFLIDSIRTDKPVAPVYDVKMAETLIPLDYGIMYIAAHADVFGYNTVRTCASETGYGIVTEIGYLKLGDDVVIVMLPGEVSPALTFGTNPAFADTAAWQGEYSWTGQDWTYDTIENYAKGYFGTDIRVVAMGICNDEIGYVMPDTDCAENFLTKTLIGGSFGDAVGRGDNEELMETGRNAGSALVGGYAGFFSK